MNRNKKWVRVDQNIYKKEGGDTYYVRVKHRGRAITKIAGRRRKDARGLLVKIKNEINEGIIGINKIPDITFEEMAERFLEYCQEELIDPSRPAITIKHAMSLFEGMLIREITAWDIEKYKKMRRNARKKSGKHISETTIRKELLHLNRLFVLADRWDMVPPGYNPVKKVEKPRENEGRVPELTMEEEKRLLLACPPGIQPIVRFAIYSGLRRGEIIGLTWNRVDMERHQVYLDRTKNKRQRHVRLCQTAMDVLASLYSGQRKGHVFLSERHGKPYTTLNASFNRARKKAGLDDLIFHDLRHVFASRLRERGASLSDIVEALGQRDIKMALRYAHLSSDYMGDVVSLLDEPEEAKEKQKVDRRWTAKSKEKKPRLQAIENNGVSR